MTTWLATSFRPLGLACLAATLLSAGCMSSPHHGEYIGAITNPVEAAGFSAKPNENITLQCRRSSNSAWETIGWTKSGNYAINYNGEQWYFWSADVVVPQNCWSPFFNGYVTEFRALRNGSQPVYTFDSDFYDCLNATDGLTELWDECGHGTSVHIFGGAP